MSNPTGDADRAPEAPLRLRMVGNSVIYTVVSLLQKALGFFLLPIYTTYLTTHDYGVVNVVGSLTGLLSVLYLLSLNGAATRFEFKYRSDEERTRRLWGTLLVFVGVNTIAVTLVCYLLRGWLLEPLLEGIPFHPFMLLGLAGVALSPPYALFQAQLQARQMGRQVGLNNLIYFLVTATLTLLLVVVLGRKAEGVLLAVALTNAAFFVYALVAFLPRVSLRFDSGLLRESLGYSLPLVPHAVAGWVMGVVDRLFLNYYRSPASVGVYSIGYQVANLINVVTASVSQAYVPWFYEKFEDGDAGKQRIARLSEVIVTGYALLALVVSLFAPEVLRVMVSADFREGFRVIPLVAFSFVFGGVYYVFVLPLFVRRTTVVPVISLTSAALGAILNLVLVPRYGMIGAALSGFLAMAASSLVALVLSQRLEPIGLAWGRILAYATLPFLLSFAVFLHGHVGAVRLLALKLAIAVGATAIAYLLHREEVDRLARALRARRWRKP